MLHGSSQKLKLKSLLAFKQNPTISDLKFCGKSGKFLQECLKLIHQNVTLHVLYCGQGEFDFESLLHIRWYNILLSAVYNAQQHQWL